MRILKLFYWDYDKNDVKRTKSFEHKSYDCPHCNDELEFTEKDIGRSLVNCRTCDYGMWVYPNGEIEELDW